MPFDIKRLKSTPSVRRIHITRVKRADKLNKFLRDASNILHRNHNSPRFNQAHWAESLLNLRMANEPKNK